MPRHRIDIAASQHQAVYRLAGVALQSEHPGTDAGDGARHPDRARDGRESDPGTVQQLTDEPPGVFPLPRGRGIGVQETFPEPHRTYVQGDRVEDRPGPVHEHQLGGSATDVNYQGR